MLGIISRCLMFLLCQIVSGFKLYSQLPVHQTPLNGKPVHRINSLTKEDVSTSWIRRVRYSGKYPRVFKDRYKERSGDADTVAKVVMKGGTPAGQHRPVMLAECLEYLGLSHKTTAYINQHDTPLCVDCTLGYGGHASALLTTIADKRGTLYAIDQDHIELTKTVPRMQQLANNLTSRYPRRNTSILYTEHANFGRLLEYTDKMNITGKVTAVLCDLGYSSMQVDDPARGFTYKSNGPLDLRMDTIGSTFLPTESAESYSVGTRMGTAESSSTISINNATRPTGYEYLCQISSASALASVLHTNSDIVPAISIATALLGPHKEKREPPKSTIEFANRVRTGLAQYAKKIAEQSKKNKKKGRDELVKKVDYTDKRVIESHIVKALQAIRIAVNSEFEMLESLLKSLPVILAPGGRIVFLTFHSGEDRRVKKALKGGVKDGIYSTYGREVVLASEEERYSNPRSKSAKLRWAERA